MDRICGIVDFEGFRAKVKTANGSESDQFLVREIAFVPVSSSEIFPVKFHHFNLGCFKWIDFSQKERETIVYQQRYIHGLSFYPRNEHTLDYKDRETVVKCLYYNAINGKRNVLSFKGGNCEKQFLEDMSLPYLDIEKFGCPTFKELAAKNPAYKDMECGLHVGMKRTSHCAMAEVTAYRDWLMQYENRVVEEE